MITALTASLLISLIAPARGIPAPLPGHPGNIFLMGERVSVPVPDSGDWVLEDYDGRRQSAQVANGRADLGELPPGYYRLRHPQGMDSSWISFGVLPRLKAPTPLSSPISIDAAPAWFYADPEQIKAVANLCALAGVNRIRDRMAWGEIETARDVYAARTRYDVSLSILASAGLQALTVNHQTPAWASSDTQHFPPDLRDIYRFYKTVGKRWRGLVSAIEPWNEADIEGFGGQTGCEIAALQKACYLALKETNPELNVCMNVWAQHVKYKLADFEENRAWPYFDTYDLHHYEEFAGYPRLYADHRAVSAGRPLWVTECALPVRWAGDASLQEPSETDLRLQAERLPKVYACALNEGVTAAYYFILGHYVEGQTQFGILRKDLSPRPAYVALAAAGRLLCDARAVGTLKLPASCRGYLFNTKFEGNAKSVEVIWREAPGNASEVTLPADPVAAYDLFGRPLQPSRHLAVTSAPTYVVFNRETQLDVVPPPAPAKWLSGAPGKVVLQPLWERSRTALARSACRISLSQPSEFNVYAYNFGQAPVAGSVTATIEGGWHVAGGGPMVLAPMERRKITLHITPGDPGASGFVRMQVTGQFGAHEQPVASVRFVPENDELVKRSGLPPVGSKDPAAWDLMVANGRKPTAVGDGDSLVFSAAPEGDAWFYPKFNLKRAGEVPKGALGLACTITLLEGDASFKFIYDETNGASYVADAVIAPTPGKAVQTAGLFADSSHGDGWSAPDPKGEIDAAQITAFKIGCNGKRGGPIRFKVSDIRWIVGKQAGK